MYKILTLCIFFLLSINAFPQQVDHSYFAANREVYFRFPVSRNLINDLSSVISIDNIKNDSVYAYANEKEYSAFLNYRIPCIILPPPGLSAGIKMSSGSASILAWDAYPTYNSYVSMMMQFQTAHPDICKIIEVGTTVQGRKLLYAKITQNVNVKAAKPQFMYTSSMHGDEITGYVTMLRLIDTLVNSYNTDKRITNIINNVELWINPLANPDGTYHLSDTTVNGATRYNANSVDLNRNFPDPVAGQHPDHSAWQPETISIMNLEAANNFSLAANFHGGSEVVNYPWDTWKKLCPDDAWYSSISRKFADTVHAYSYPGYMTDLDNGITNGYAWYRITGGRQDYMNYFSRGREVTIEISTVKLMPPSLLPSYWNYLSHSLLDFIENTYYGIRGTVTDTSGNPIRSLITIAAHDTDNSDIRSDSLTGSYYRMIAPGIYNVTFSADSFVTKTINNITVKNDSASILNVQLVSKRVTTLSGFNNFPGTYNLSQNYPNPFNPSTTIKYEIPRAGKVSLKVYNLLGREVSTLVNYFKSPGTYEITFSSSALPSGVYFYKLQAGQSSQVKTMMLIK